MTLPSEGRLLAVDIGTRRHGVAHTDPSQTVAQPVATIEQRAGKRFPYTKLEPFLADVAGVVVGLPLELDGSEGPAAGRAREIAEVIARRSGRPVVMWDERHTTSQALRSIQEMGGSVRGRRGDVDKLAAAILLQTFLESRRCEPTS